MKINPCCYSGAGTWDPWVCSPALYHLATKQPPEEPQRQNDEEHVPDSGENVEDHVPDSGGNVKEDQMLRLNDQVQEQGTVRQSTHYTSQSST